MGPLVYLDQNKWIQMARVLHGKELSQDTSQDVNLLVKLAEAGQVVLPLSSVHIIETSRITNPGRRKRLGSVMWKYSSRYRMAAYTTIVDFEIRNALHQLLPDRCPLPTFDLIGTGLEHAFGLEFPWHFLDVDEEHFEKSVVTGRGPDGGPALPHRNREHGLNFMRHLQKIPHIDKELPEGNWEDYMMGISLVDVLEPLNTILLELKIDPGIFKSRDFIAKLIKLMPTRVLEVHLHTQLFKNKTLQPTPTDLDDWSGLGIGAMYCDYVICEKHFANLLNRDAFIPNAQIETDFSFVHQL